MDLSVEKSDVEWYDTFPRRGEVYDLVYTAESGPDKNERMRAVDALGKSGDPSAVSPLMDLATDNDPDIRASVISALGSLKSGRSVEVLIERLTDPGEQPDIRKAAVAALATIRSTGAIRGLKEFIADEGGDPAICTSVKDILDGMGI